MKPATYLQQETKYLLPILLAARNADESVRWQIYSEVKRWAYRRFRAVKSSDYDLFVKAVAEALLL